MLAEICREELSDTLDTVAMEVLAEGGVRQPPVDAFALAAALGVAVAEDECQPGRARFVRLAGYRSPRPRATILVSPDPRRERKHWAVAHEIGEHTACRVFAALGAEPCEAAPGAREAVANYLAGRLLLPSAWFGDDAARCGWDLIALKILYGTASHELIARRMLDFGPPVIMSIFDHGALYFRRGNLPGCVPPLSPAERECWRQVHRENLPWTTREGIHSIHGWPVHEPGWRREILRTEVEEEFDP